jgi:hypothetical protein
MFPPNKWLEHQNRDLRQSARRHIEHVDRMPGRSHPLRILNPWLRDVKRVRTVLCSGLSE